MSGSTSYQPSGWSAPKSQPCAHDAHIRTFNHLARYHLRHSSGSEWRLLLFLLHDTLGRGLKHHHYHMSQLREGVRTAGKLRCRGTALAENTLSFAMDVIGMQELVTIRTGNGPGRWFEFNVDRWMNPADEEDDEDAVQFVPRVRHQKAPDYERLPAPPGAHIQAVRSLASEWAPELSDSELKTLIFLVDATLGRNRARGHYTLHHIMHGVPRRDGEGLWNCGTDLSRRATIKAIQDLQERGLIEVETVGPGARIFKVNHLWTPPGSQEGETGGATEGSKEASNVIDFPAKGGANFEAEGCKLRGEGVQTLRTSNNNQNLQSPKPTITTIGEAPLRRDTGEEIPTHFLTEACPRAEAPLTPQPPVPRANGKSSEAKEAVEQAEAAWREAWADMQARGAIDPGLAPKKWDADDKKTMRQFAAHWQALGYRDLPDFMRFVVTDWCPIIREIVPSQMADPVPHLDIPRLTILCCMPIAMDTFINAYSTARG